VLSLLSILRLEEADMAVAFSAGIEKRANEVSQLDPEGSAGLSSSCWSWRES
jgi:hypothetical protein